MKIQTTEAVRSFNAKVELSDYALGLAAVDVSDVRQLATLLNLAGHHGLRSTLLESAAELGYCVPDGGPGQQPGQPPDKSAASSPTKSADHYYDRAHLRNVIERLLNSYAGGRKSQKPENLHTAVRSAMEAIGEL